MLAERRDAVAANALGLGLLKVDKTTIGRYATGRALDGVYVTIGEEEEKIRADMMTVSASLKKVFARNPVRPLGCRHPRIQDLRMEFTVNACSCSRRLCPRQQTANQLNRAR